MNTPAATPGSKSSSIPAYRKWYFGSTAKPMLRGMRTASEPDPLPFEPIHEKDNHKVGPPSTSADGYNTYGTFTIPEGADGKKLYGTCSLFLGVDDWGSLEVKDSGGKVVAQVDLKENSQEAGDKGGHKYHTGTGGAQLPSGSYSWEVNQTNIDYKPEKDNVSICNYSIDVVPTEPGGKKEPEPCSCEGDTCDNSGGTPPSPSLARSGSAAAGVKSGTVVECGYDDQGRLYMKKVTVNGTVASHERYLYRGYLQLAALDRLDSRNVIRTLLWDPLEPVATRPLALVQNNALYCYGTDFNKNVTEVFNAQGTVVAAYDYSP